MELDNRKNTLLFIVIGLGLLLIFRLTYLQVIHYDVLNKEASAISENKVSIYPARGLIYDRNGILLVGNTTVYDIMVTPRQVGEIDTNVFCSLLGITKDAFLNKIKKACTYPNVAYKSSIFEKQITPDEFALIGEQLYKYSGFSYQERSLRNYPMAIGAHVLGFIGEVNQKTIDNNPKVYQLGNYIGITGIEATYEKKLRGKKGVKYIVKDALGNEKISYKNHFMDTATVSGKNITISIDAILQQYGEKLMRNKIGSIVAIEPATGEILAMVSTPSYNPNLLVGRIRGKNYFQLQKDSLNPLFNRALGAEYPPGSIFKIVQALVGLQLGVVNENTGFTCLKSLVNCHNHPTPSTIQKALQYSCNSYFYQLTKRVIQQGKSQSIFKDSRIGLGQWKRYVQSFGLGGRLETDISGVGNGFIPGPDYYDKIYGKYRWAYSTIYSISIGQGEVSTTPLQMANLSATIANRGYYFTPHFIKSTNKKMDIPSKFAVPNRTLVDSGYFELIAEGMRWVVEEPSGTARRARIDSIHVCGKTGTAQNPHGEDHSVFIAFAPKDNPKIAIAVYVENAGFGGIWAAPIAGLMMEKYIKGTISDLKKEERILSADFIHKNKKN